MKDNLNLIGIAKKAGFLEAGEEPTGASARAGAAKLIVVAENAAPNSKRRASHFAEFGKAPVVCLPYTKEELGAILGRTSCAMAAITDTGIAAALLKKLKEDDPAAFEAQNEAMQKKLQLLKKRKKELQAHIKNKRLGKRKKRCGI